MLSLDSTARIKKKNIIVRSDHTTLINFNVLLLYMYFKISLLYSNLQLESYVKRRKCEFDGRVVRPGNGCESLVRLLTYLTYRPLSLIEFRTSLWTYS